MIIWFHLWSPKRVRWNPLQTIFLIQQHSPRLNPFQSCHSIAWPCMGCIPWFGICYPKSTSSCQRIQTQRSFHIGSYHSSHKWFSRCSHTRHRQIRILRLIRHREREICRRVLQLCRASHQLQKHIPTPTQRSLLSTICRHSRGDVYHQQKLHSWLLQRAIQILTAIQKQLLCYVQSPKYARVGILQNRFRFRHQIRLIKWLF